MVELFAKPAVCAIIEKEENAIKYVLMQTRQKASGGITNGKIEFAGGKIREYENIFDTLRREVLEETGLVITEIEGEKDTVIDEIDGFKILSFNPFYVTQNTSGNNSFLLNTFICRATGEFLKKTDESEDIRWVSVEELRNIYISDRTAIFQMHVNIVKKYLML
jgi:8-oxo-dGTP pyrophosphatase MutT (NUDIX family)